MAIKKDDKMKLPTVFTPDKNLDEKVERVIKQKTISTFASLIYDSLQVIKNVDNERTYEDFSYSAPFQFNEGTKIVLAYKNQPFFEREKGLTYIDGYSLGLGHISIKSTIKNPVEAIEQTFSANPLEYKSLPFQQTQSTLNKLVEKDNPLLNGAKQFRESLVIDRIACHYLEKENCYKLTEGNFYLVVKTQSICRPKNYREKLKKILGVKEETFRTMSIYEVLPFTEKEKEILSGLEEFEISYRFPRPNEDADLESKHLFRFRIKKTGDKYETDLDISDGFTSGLDLKSIWPAEKLFDYLNSERKMVRYNEKISRYAPKTNRYASSDEKKLYEKALDPLYLYEKDAESFIGYFSSRSVEEKKKLIENMMGCDFTNERVIAWLNENEAELVREVGLK